MGLPSGDPRAQQDKDRYQQTMLSRVLATDGLTVLEGEVSGLEIADHRIGGVQLADGRQIQATQVVMTTGTFLRGLLHLGLEQTPGGRVHEEPANALSDALKDQGFRMGRFKTGTPPRLSRASVDLKRFELQPGDETPTFFSEGTPPNLLAPDPLPHGPYQRGRPPGGP